MLEPIDHLLIVIGSRNKIRDQKKSRWNIHTKAETYYIHYLIYYKFLLMRRVEVIMKGLVCKIKAETYQTHAIIDEKIF